MVAIMFARSSAAQRRDFDIHHNTVVSSAPKISDAVTVQHMIRCCLMR